MERSLWQQHVVLLSAVLLVSSRRNAMSCLGMSCPDKLHHVCYSQGAAHGPDDTMWWTDHNQANANNETLNQSSSILKQCHINFRTTREQYSTPRDVFLRDTRKKKSNTKLHNNSATPTAQTTLQSNFCGNKMHIPGTLCAHTLKPLPARRLQVQWRRRLPHGFPGGSVR